MSSFEPYVTHYIRAKRRYRTRTSKGDIRNGEVERWIPIAGENGYEVYINGEKVATVDAVKNVSEMVV